MHKKNIIIHIGAHKTGTTSQQRYFHLHQRELSKLGFLYPSSCRFQFAQHRLAFALKHMKDPADMQVPDLAAESEALLMEMEKSDCPFVFISSEEFFSLKKSGISLLHDLLNGHEVRIVAVLRRPDELFAWIYNQMVKEPKNRFLRRYTTFMDDPARLSPDLHFDRALQSWVEVFGPDSIIVRCFEQYDDAIALVAEAIGLDREKLPPQGHRANVSVSVRTAELIRLGKHAGLSESQLRQILMVGNVLFGLGSKTESLLSPQERIEILRSSDEMTDWVFGELLQMENIYSSSRFKAKDFPPKTVLKPVDCMQIISHLLPASIDG